MTIRIALAINPAAEMAVRPSSPEWVLVTADGWPPDRSTVSALREAAHRARTCGASHLAALPCGTLPTGADLQRLAEACRAHPEALILGRRGPAAHAGWRQRWAEGPLARFWLKIQTGRHLDDPASPLRIYPLAVIDHLRLFQAGKALETEILVKSAWADVPLREVRLTGDAAHCRTARESPWRLAWRFLLNVHYTLRSVLPVPHRKLATRADKPGEAISVWRPMRSLRTLLRENTSPSQLALAAAMGVFLGTLPLIACHTVVIILTATYFRLNKVAALAASQLCMPPVVPALCIEVGHLVRHGRFLTEISLETLGYQALERLYEWLIGALVLAPFLAGLIGGITLILARLAARSMVGGRNVHPKPGNSAGR